MTGFAQKLLLLGVCCCLVLLLLAGPVLAQEDAIDRFSDDDDRQIRHAKSDDINQGVNATLRCWYCLSRHRTWADCQYNNEVDICTPDAATGVVSCLRSSVLYQRANGNSKQFRFAGCALNQSALNDILFEAFEVSFNETSPTSNTTLVEFDTCSGALCNVMDAEALRLGSSRKVVLNVMNVNASPTVGPLAGLIVTVLGVVFAMK